MKKLLVITLSIIMMFAMSVPAFAADEQITNDYIKINKPAQSATYYVGQKISYSVKVTNPWGGTYWCRPFAALMQGSNQIYYVPANYYLTSAGYNTFTGKFKTAGLSKGTYYFAALAMPIYPNTENEVGRGNQQYAGNTIHLKKLPKPSKVTLKTGKGKVTVKIKKVKAAKKYLVYRSLKKSSGYKKIGTTTSLKYVDKKAKKGKRYYYKVKSYRYGAKSAYTKAVRSKKVK